MANVLDELKAQDTEALERYRQLVFDLAQEDSPPADTVREILRDAGRTPEQLQKHVQTATKRLEAARVIQQSDGPDFEGIRSLQLQHATKREEREALVAEHAKQLQQLDGQLQQLRDEISSLDKARRQRQLDARNLLENTSDPGASAETKRIADAGHSLRTRREQLDAERKGLESRELQKQIENLRRQLANPDNALDNAILKESRLCTMRRRHR